MAFYPNSVKFSIFGFLHAFFTVKELCSCHMLFKERRPECDLIPRQYHYNTLNFLHHCYWWSCIEVDWWISCVSHCILLILGSCVCYYGDLWQGPIKPFIIGSGVTVNPTLFLCRPFLMNYVDSWLFLNFFFFEGSHIFTRTALQVRKTSVATNKQYFCKRRNCVFLVYLIINHFSD